MGTFEGVARPVTARTRAGPRDSLTRRTAATNSRGDRSNWGPLARNTISAFAARDRSFSAVTIATSPTGGSSGNSRSAIDRGVPFDGGRSSACPASRGPKKLPLTRICRRGSSIRFETRRASAKSGAGCAGVCTNSTRGVARARPDRVHVPFRPRPPCASSSNIGNAAMVRSTKKAPLLDGHRVPLDVGQFLRLERPLVDAQDQGRLPQGNLLVDVFEEVQDASEVVVDHEVFDPVEQDRGPSALVQESPDQVAEAVQVVRIDVVPPQGRREPHDADVLVPPPADHVVRMLPRDVERSPSGVDRLLEHREGSLRLLLLHQVGPSLLQVLLLSEEQILEKLVLLESEQERPR